MGEVKSVTKLNQPDNPISCSLFIIGGTKGIANSGNMGKAIFNVMIVKSICRNGSIKRNNPDNKNSFLFILPLNIFFNQFII